MTRPRSRRVVQRDEALLPRIQALKAEHPCWGDRRIWAYRRFVEPLPVNTQRMWRLMRAPHRRVPHHLQRKAQRTPAGAKPKPAQPNQW